MRRFISAALLQYLLLSFLNAPTFAQVVNGQVGGTVQDASKAVVPGVTVTLTNTGTGVVTSQSTNESGVYNFSSVPAGIYSLTGSLPGFKTSVTNGVQVSLAPVRVNIALEVGQLDSKVEVLSPADNLLIETSASVGVALTQQRVTDLPLIGQNVLDLLSTLPGFRESSFDGFFSNGFAVSDEFSDAHSSVGGLNLDSVNTTINGLSTVSTRDAPSSSGRQVMTSTVINPDLVAGIHLILSPVDAELGRGNAQVQIQTRSGTNRYAGSVVWDVQNSALNANTWENKRTPTPTQPEWYNLNQITASYGGPIIRNKTFFFVLYDTQLVNRRRLFAAPVLTDSARQGIWRYWEGWSPGNASAPQPTSFVAANAQPTGTAPSVDFDGNPIAPRFNPTGSPYTLGGLRCFSVFGNIKVDGSPFTQADCPGGTAVINASPWDPFRTTVDSTGYIRKLLALMPKPNFFGGVVGDGLNTGLYRWLQGRKGSGLYNFRALAGVVASTFDYNNRDQINLRLDHNITANHRVSVSWTYEKSPGQDLLASWDGVLNGNQSRRARFLTVNATSTLSPRLVNEARFGMNNSRQFQSPAWTNVDHPDIREAAQQFILYGGTNATNGKKYPVLYNPGTNWNGFMNFSSTDSASYNPLYDYADTVRWTSGRHLFSFGGEYRRPSTAGYGFSPYSQATPGNAGGTATPLFFINENVTNGAAFLPGFLATSRGNAGTLLSTLYGAIDAPNTNFWIDGQADLRAGRWQDVTTIENRIRSDDPYAHKTFSQISNEWTFFIKDDYKLNSRLTLNLGVRYDFTGSPYLTNGLTNRIDGGGLGLFGAGRPVIGDPFSNWLRPGNLFLAGYGSTAANPLQCVQGVINPNGLPASNCNPDLTSKFVFVGPKTDHSDQTFRPESGRFSPAIGFSWQLPWFGNATTVRGGFQRTDGQAGPYFDGGFQSFAQVSEVTSGVNTSDPTWTAIFANRAANLTDLAFAVPAKPSRPPGDRVFQIGSRSFASLDYAHYDPHYAIPFTDNWTLAVQHSLRRNMTVEIRTVNTFGRNLGGAGVTMAYAGQSYDLNTVNVYHNPELFNALEVTREGGNDPLFDQMLMGMNLNIGVAGYGAVGTCVPIGSPNCVLQRGSAHLRRAPTFASNLANGNYAAVAQTLLSVGSTGAGGLQPLPIDPTTGKTLVTSQRALRNGCDRIANDLTGGFTNPDTGFQILPRCFPENYLIANPQFDRAQYAKNVGYSNYHSFDVQFTMRPTDGLSLTATYGFSKQMGQPGYGFTDPLNPSLDYGEALNSGSSSFRTNGTFELPIGPNKLWLATSSGWLGRVVERWQMGFIYNWSSGAPRNILTGINHLYANGRPNIVGPWTNPKGEVRWDGQNGQYFKDHFATYQDPQCLTVTTADNLRTNCSLKGLARIVPQGTLGSIELSSGTYGIPLLENPPPGHQGNLGPATMNTVGRWSLDANLAKTLRISESKSVQLRIDAKNIFNHPTPLDPTGLGSRFGNSFTDNLGQITSKGGNRTFQAKLRISF